MKKGVLAVVTASFIYGIMPIFIKMALLEGMSSGSVVFYRLFFSAIFSFIIIKVMKIDMTVSKKQLLQMGFFGIMGMGATMALLTVAYNYIPTGLATMIHFTYPLTVTLVMTLIFKEKLSKAKVISCLFALGGIILMADFSVLSVFGIITALCSGMTYASYVIANKKSSFSTLNGLVIVFYVSCFASVFFGAKAVITKEFMLPVNMVSLVLLCGIALFCTVISLFLINYGIRTLGASNAAIINMLEPIISLIAGIIVYKETMNIKCAIGCVCVVAAGITAALDSSNNQTTVKVHKNTQAL